MITSELVCTVGDKMNKSLSVLLKLSFIFCLPSSVLYSYPEGWSDDILINQDTTASQNSPDVSTDSCNNVWITWYVATWTEGEVFYSKRDSLGNCLIPETTVSNNASRSTLARVVIEYSDNVHFVWRDDTPQGIGLWHAKLANDGSEIVSSHLAVSGAGGVGVSTLYFEIVLNKYQEVNISWDEAPSGYNQMDYTKLDTLGNPIIEKIRVSPENITAYWVGIGVDSFANNHMACRTDSGGISNRLTYSKLGKDGNFLIFNKILGDGAAPSIIADRNQNIHMVYTNPTGPGNRIDYLKLNQNGNILVGPRTISSPQIHSNTYAHMAIDSLQYLHVVWQGDSSAIFHIMYCKLDTLGNYVIPPMKIVHSPYTTGAGEPRIAVDHSNRLHVVWFDNRLGTQDIFYKRGENETAVKEIEKLKIENLPEITVYPNPFWKETKIVFSLSPLNTFETLQETNKHKIEIYDIIGRKLKTFILGESDGVIIWKGTDDLGNYLPAGVYFLRVVSSMKMQSIPIVLLR